MTGAIKIVNSMRLGNLSCAAVWGGVGEWQCTIFCCHLMYPSSHILRRLVREVGQPCYWRSCHKCQKETRRRGSGIISTRYLLYGPDDINQIIVSARSWAGHSKCNRKKEWEILKINVIVNVCGSGPRKFWVQNSCQHHILPGKNSI